jgi:light-regulated signal transduction histidine kinase (bacteriophytochrome)
LDLLLRAPTVTQRMPLVFLTGLGNLEVAVEAMRLGAIDYLDKNLLSAALLERSLRYAIENFRVNQALRVANEQLEIRVAERTAELERRNQELERFAYLASHELQMPLQTITAHMEQFRGQRAQGDGDPDELGQYFLNRAYEGARRMQSLVSNVLEYSRVGKRRISPGSVDLNVVLRDVLAELEVPLRNAGATVVASGLPYMRVDAELVGRVFKNLVGNALKFRSDSPPEIRVWARPMGDECLLAVQDNGIGIEPADHQEIFLMFHRGRSANGAPGEGIGLAFCQRIVGLHGGRIWVESTPGAGATFFFTLPGLVARAPVAPSACPAPPDGAPVPAPEGVQQPEVAS